MTPTGTVLIALSTYLAIGFCVTLGEFLYQKIKHGRVLDESAWIFVIVWPLGLFLLPWGLGKLIVWTIEQLPIGPREKSSEAWPEFPQPPRSKKDVK